MSKIELVATATFGLEALVAREVRDLGYYEGVQVENGQVSFWGDELAVCRCNLWLRCAERLLIKIGKFTATTFDQLFEQTKALPWAEWLVKDAQFPVIGKSRKSTLSSVPACQAIVKKAIVAKMSEHYGVNWFSETGPLYRIRVIILEDVVTLMIDTSGDGLHKRGYRELATKAPLKETLAAGLIYLSNWKRTRQLVDPFCGSGTIPIEAGLIGRNIAPGINRSFASEDWPIISSRLWQQAREEAHSVIRDDQFRILGYDHDKETLKMARYHAKKANLSDFIDFHQLSLNQLKSSKKYGYIICNPPYGQRLSDPKAVKLLAKEMGSVFAKLGDGTWSFYILTGFEDFERSFGTLANKKRKLFNGRIRVDFYQYFGARPSR